HLPLATNLETQPPRAIVFNFDCAFRHQYLFETNPCDPLLPITCIVSHKTAYLFDLGHFMCNVKQQFNESFDRTANAFRRPQRLYAANEHNAVLEAIAQFEFPPFDPASKHKLATLKMREPSV
ncbi:hypothetical protein, partial [Caballeronia mineralivorans]|uniref:hypothetical protein n=1 Tax=Caballeronia mineralivorans TaxID=2010198 RepID=UPI001F2C4CE5